MLLCLSGNNTLTLPMVGAILYDIPSLHYIYIFFASIGLISNCFSLTTFTRDRIRFTIIGVYLIIYSLCSFILMIVILTNIIIIFRYDDYFIRLWACHGYPYIFVVMINMSILMTTMIIIENILNRYFSFDRFRSRKYVLFISFNLFLLVLISNLDKIDIFVIYIVLLNNLHVYI